MNLSTRFAVSVHILSVLYFNEGIDCDSEYISRSVNTNPVVIRKLVTSLKRAGLVHVTPGKKGITPTKQPKDITLYEVYNAVDNVNSMLFGLHDNTNANCPVGRNINTVLQEKMESMHKVLVESMREYTMDDVMKGIYTLEEPS